MAKPTAKETALEIKKTADELGWNINVRNNNTLLEITKRLEPATKENFVRADSEYYSILGLLPSTSPGSIFGTDGGGVGALSAMSSGLFVMKKTGGSKRVLNALAKLV